MSKNTSLTLCIPDLFSALSTKSVSGDLSQLSLVLSKASIQSFPQINNRCESIAEILGCATAVAKAKAALHLYGTGQTEASWVCFASPVLLQSNRDHMAITQADGFLLTDEEGDALTLEFNDYFKDDGIRFEYQTTGRWVCFSDKHHNITDQSPQRLVGENIMNYLPAVKEGILWRKVFNEMQMLLHHSVTNKMRISNSKSEINSLWFFGGGVLPNAFQTDYAAVYANKNEILGLSKLGSAQVSVLQKKIEATHLVQNSSVLIYLDKQDYSLIDDYVNDALAMIKDKTLSDLTLILSVEKKFSLTRQDLMKFWKRPKEIGSFIE